MASSRFIAPYVQWFQKTTDAPLEYAEASALACLSTISLGRRWLVGTERLHPNVFMMLVGPSTVARKSTAVKRARMICEEVEPDFIGPSDYTPEGLFKMLATQKGSNGKPLQKMTLFAPEYGADLARSMAYASTLQADFCSLYDCDPIKKVRAHAKTLTIDKPRVSLFAAVAYEMLKQHLKPSDWLNGFLMRFLFVGPVTMRPEFSHTPPAAPLEHGAAKTALQVLRDDLEATKTNGKGAKQFDPAAAVLLDSYKKHLANWQRQKMPHIMQVYIGRFTVSLQKLALLFQVDLDPQANVSVLALDRAIQFIERACWPSFMKTYELTALRDFDALSIFMLEQLKHAGTNGVLRSTLTERFGSNKLSIDVIEYAKRSRIVLGFDTPTKDERLIWRGSIGS